MAEHGKNKIARKPSENQREAQEGQARTNEIEGPWWHVGKSCHIRGATVAKVRTEIYFIVPPGDSHAQRPLGATREG